jgi:adenylate cyclase
MKSKSDDREAILGRENAELRRQLGESLAQQDALSKVLRGMAHPGVELAVVLQTVVSAAHRLCRADYAVLFRNEGGAYRWAAGHAMAGGSEERERNAVIHPGTGTLIGRAVLEGRVVQIEDAWTDPHYDAKEDAREGGIRTMLGVPLMREGEAIGAIGLARSRIEPFTEPQIALVKSFARQAVIAMENARLITETREALDQQTATAEVLQVINSSPGDLAPVFEAMLDKALQLCDANYGYLLTYDGEGLVPVADRGNPAFSAWVRKRGKIAPEPGTINARIIGGELVVQVADVINDPFYQGDTAMRRAVVEIGGFRTVLTVALRKDELLLGVIHIYRQEVRPFSDRQIALLQNFAAQAVIAMENARLLTETRESLERQTATSDILRVIAASPGDAEGTLRKIAETTMRLFNAAGASFRIADGDAYSSAIIVGRGAEDVSASLSDPDHLVRPRTLPGTVIHENRQIHLPDLDHLDPAFADWPGPPIFRGAGMRTLVGTPLRRRGQAFGALIVYRDELRPFTPEELQLLQSFADQAVIAMENARLLGELRQRTEEVAALNRGLEARVAEQVEELGRVGRLKRFLAPQLAELIVSQGDEKILESHRREIVVVFCDLRGYTAFTETAEPEEVLDFLREYHGALGPLVSQYEGTLDQFSGDGIMVFFNDPVPIPDPAERAVKMAMAMREEASALTALWRRRGRELGFGAGIAQGYATLGQIGFSERSGYTAIGTVCNVAARLCAEAKDGQILIAQRVAAGLDGDIALEEIGPLALKGITQPVVALNVALDGNAASRLRLV